MSVDHIRNARLYDTLHIGRSCIDLYVNEVGAPFINIKSFAAYEDWFSS